MMNLKKLIDFRSNTSMASLPMTELELCQRYENVTTAIVNDVLRENGQLYQTLPNSIQPLSSGMRVAGIAFTVKGSKSLDISDEMSKRAEMLESIKENSIVVWDTSDDDESAQWGEIMTLASMKRGCRGAVVDGGVRDTDKVLEMGFPIFCKYRTSNGMMGRFKMIGYQMPVNIGNVHIYPGDIILCDIDGCIVIPRTDAYKTLLKAEQIKINEIEIKEMVMNGLLPSEVVKNGGYF